MKNQNSKTNKGITLIALIIAIVVLLILAAVSIQLVMNSKIITHGKNAVDKYDIAQTDEKGKISGAEDVIEKKIAASLGIGEATLESIVDKNSTINGKVYSSTNPIIPAGFKAINVTTIGQESDWDSESGPEVDKGLVIVDEAGNEFVCVPVTTEIVAYKGYKSEPDVFSGSSGNEFDAATTNLNIAGCTKDLTEDGIVDINDFRKQLTDEFELMAASIKKYGGFYVGRYEISMNGQNPQSKASTENNVITSATGAQNSANTWYGLYALSKKYKTSSTQGTMIWGSQYNAMMKWMGEPASIIIDDRRNLDRTCGTAPADVIKNVYDLYGNSGELTLEAKSSSNSRIGNGGSHKNSNPPNYDMTVNPAYPTNDYSTRLALYVL